MNVQHPGLVGKVPPAADFASVSWTHEPYLFDRHLAPLAVDACSFERVERMLQSMPSQDIIYRAAAGGTAAPMRRLALPDWSTTPLHQRLATETTSLMLQNVQRYDAAIADAVTQLLDWLAAELGVATTSFRCCTASIFLSSPHAISSYHTDREQNFLAHLHGVKTIHVFPCRLGAAQEILVAMFRARKGIHFEYAPALETTAAEFVLQPGNTLYVPRNWPHWVDNGAQVSMSLSINFFRPAEYALERFYTMNDWFRACVARASRALRPDGSG